MTIAHTLADIVLIAHFALVVFVVLGLPAIVFGKVLSWRWVNGLCFRATHLGAILIVVAESWLGIVCPLTEVEIWLRDQVGAESHDQSFVQYWVGRLLFYEAPEWMFVAAYTVFGLLVAAAWWYFPPVTRGHARDRLKSCINRAEDRKPR